jgi:hypothetical protein
MVSKAGTFVAIALLALAAQQAWAQGQKEDPFERRCYRLEQQTLGESSKCAFGPGEFPTDCKKLYTAYYNTYKGECFRVERAYNYDPEQNKGYPW